MGLEPLQYNIDAAPVTGPHLLLVALWALPKFWVTVNPIPIRGADYTHHITMGLVWLKFAVAPLYIGFLSRWERFQRENQYTGTPSTIVCHRWRSWLPEIEWKEKNRHLCRNVGRISFIDFEPCGRSSFCLRPQWKWQSTVSCHSKNRA